MASRRATVGSDDEPTVPAAVQSARGKLVYRALAARGEATAGELRAATGVPKLMLYGVLGALVERGVVVVEEGVYRVPEERVGRGGTESQD